MKKNNFWKWFWRIVRFPFILAMWVVSCLILGIITSVDWLINPDKWNSLNRKEEKNGY